MRQVGPVFVLILAVAVGCESKSPPGGPGATRSGGATHTTTSSSGAATHTTGNGHSTGPLVGTPENTFKLDVPALATGLKQGETKTIAVGITRGKNFDQDVKLDFSGAPQGVTVTPTDGSIKHGDKEVHVKLEAAKDAALGEHTITVTGTPKEGAKTSVTFKIDVKKAG